MGIAEEEMEKVRWLIENGREIYLDANGSWPEIITSTGDKSPEQVVIKKTLWRELLSRVTEKFGSKNTSIFALWLTGHSYNSILEVLGLNISTQSVGNIVQNILKTLREDLEAKELVAELASGS